MTEHHRGNPIHEEKGIYVYTDTKQPVRDNPNRSCGHCGKGNTPEGHDGCIGILPYVMNACCGHGDVNDAYVQFKDGSTTNGKHALNVMRSLK